MLTLGKLYRHKKLGVCATVVGFSDGTHVFPKPSISVRYVIMEFNPKEYNSRVWNAPRGYWQSSSFEESWEEPRSEVP